MSQTDDTADLAFPCHLEHVLVSDNGSTRGIIHRPHPDDGDRPTCNRATRDGSTYRRKDHPRQVMFYRRCKGCPWPDDDEGGTWTCLDCPRQFNTLDGLRQHQQQDCPQPEVRRG